MSYEYSFCNIGVLIYMSKIEQVNDFLCFRRFFSYFKKCIYFRCDYKDYISILSNGNENIKFFLCVTYSILLVQIPYSLCNCDYQVIYILLCFFAKAWHVTNSCLSKIKFRQKHLEWRMRICLWYMWDFILS